jgi:ribosomal protein S18 acetylase RimI-like enzyme
VLIGPVSRKHVVEVAQLHCTTLKGLLSVLGLRAAIAYYTGAVESASTVGFVCSDGDRIRGYVVGSVHPAKLKREVLRHNALGTLTGLFVGILRRPSALNWLLKSFRGPDEGSYDDQAPELTYLAVAANCRSSGVGTQLVEAFTQAMRETGVDAYELSVDEDNEPAIRFYERAGFRRVAYYRDFQGLHRRYRLELNPDVPPA